MVQETGVQSHVESYQRRVTLDSGHELYLYIYIYIYIYTFSKFSSISTYINVSSKNPASILQVFVKLGNLHETSKFIESTVVTYSDSVNHNWVQVLRTPAWLLTCSQD